MKVFDDTSPKHRHALGFAAISSGLWVERAVMKTMAFSCGRAMPCIGRARRCGPSQVVIMQVEMRSMFFQMKDNCSASDRFEFESDIFSLICVLARASAHFALRSKRRDGRNVPPARADAVLALARSPRNRTAYKKMFDRRATVSGLSRCVRIAHPFPPKRCAPTQPRWSPPVAVVFCPAERRLTGAFAAE